MLNTTNNPKANLKWIKAFCFSVPSLESHTICFSFFPYLNHFRLLGRKQTCKAYSSHLPPPPADSYAKFTERILLGLQAFKDRQEIFEVSKGIYNVASFCDSISTSLSNIYCLLLRLHLLQRCDYMWISALCTCFFIKRNVSNPCRFRGKKWKRCLAYTLGQIERNPNSKSKDIP